MPYNKSNKEMKAEAKGQKKIQRIRTRGEKQISKMEGASEAKQGKLQSKAYRLKKREQGVNQRFGQKAGNVGTSRSEGNFGELKEVVVTAQKKQTTKGPSFKGASKLTGYNMPGVGSREKNTESGFRNPEDLKSRYN